MRRLPLALALAVLAAVATVKLTVHTVNQPAVITTPNVTATLNYTNFLPVVKYGGALNISANGTIYVNGRYYANFTTLYCGSELSWYHATTLYDGTIVTNTLGGGDIFNPQLSLPYGVPPPFGNITIRVTVVQYSGKPPGCP